MRAVVLTFDRLSLRFLGCYGNQWVETPNFDRLAAEAVVFDQHFAEDVDPQAAHHAWWTGRYQFPLSPHEQEDAKSWLHLLKQHGIRSRAIVEQGTESSSGFGRAGFDETVRVEGRDGLDVAVEETPAARLVTQAAEMFSAGDAVDGPQLLWLKSRGVPFPWVPPRDLATLYFEFVEGDGPEPKEAAQPSPESDVVEGAADEADFDVDLADPEDLETFLRLLPRIENRETFFERAAERDLHWIRRVYAGYVSLLDLCLGKLLSALQASGWDDVLLIVTAAEGEMLGERRFLPGGDDPLVREENIHTPLLIRGPGGQRGTRRQSLVQPVDLPATLCDWFGVEAAAISREGHSLLPVVRGEQETVREHAFLGNGRTRCGIRTGEFYVIRPASETESGEPAEPELYAKPEDLWDAHDSSAQSPEVVDELTATLDAFLEGERSNI